MTTKELDEVISRLMLLYLDAIAGPWEICNLPNNPKEWHLIPEETACHCDNDE